MCGVEGGKAYEAVNAPFGPQVTKGKGALDPQSHALDAGLLSFASIEDLGAVAAAFRPAQVHPLEHLCPILGVGASSAGVDVRGGVVVVVGAGEHGLQLAVRHVGLDVANFGVPLRPRA